MKLAIAGQAISVAGLPVALPMPRITVSGKNLIRAGQTFKAFGVQPLYTRWLMDYFQTGGADERRDILNQIRGAREYGANVIRIHLDLWDFIEGASENALSTITLAFTNFIYLLGAAKQHGIYVLVSGNNTWDSAVSPAWYDALPYATRWDVQAFFFEELAAAVLAAGHSTTVMGYELMSEPGITDDPAADWYIGSFGNEFEFVQNIARGVAQGSQPAVTRDWITQLSAAIKGADPKANVTVGLLPMGGQNFGPDNIDDLLDFLSPHLYPPAVWVFPTDTLAQQIAYAEMWAASSLPNVIGESVNWSFVEGENAAFLDAVLPIMQGYITFYWGYPPASHTLPPAPPRYPATAATVTDAAYALHASSLAVSLGYRTEFLGA